MLYIVGMAKSGSKSPSSKAKGRLVSSKVAYRGPVFWVTTDRVLEPGGVKVRRDLIHHSGSVVVLAVDRSKSVPRILLERQYRHAAQDYLWELPAGRISSRILLAETDIAVLDARAERVNDVRSDVGVERFLHPGHKIVGHDDGGIQPSAR